MNSRILELAPETYKENNELTSITPGLGEIKSGYGNQIARKYAYFSCFNKNLVKLTVRDNFAPPKKLMENSHFKGSSDPIHFIFETNVGKSRIRYRTTLNLNDAILNRF